MLTRTDSTNTSQSLFPSYGSFSSSCGPRTTSTCLIWKVWSALCNAIFVYSCRSTSSTNRYILKSQAYSIGEGPMAFLISPEVYPLVNREIGMSFAVRFDKQSAPICLKCTQVFCNFIGAGFISVIAPVLTHATRHWGLFIIFL